MFDPLILIAALGGAALVKLLLSSPSAREEDEAWRLAARRVRGELELVPGTWTKPATRTLRLETAAVPIVIDTYEERLGNPRTEYTRASSGALPGSSWVKLDVAPRGLLRKLSKSLGIGESPTGDAAFDAAFVVSASPRGIASAFLDRATRGVVMQAATKLELGDCKLLIVADGLPKSDEPIVAMARFAERIVERWASLVRGPTRVAARLGFVCETSFDLVEKRVFARGVHRGRAASMVLVVDDDGARIVLSCDGPGELRLTFDGLEPDPEDVIAALDAALDARAGGYR